MNKLPLARRRKGFSRLQITPVHGSTYKTQCKATVYRGDIRTSPASMTVFRLLTDKHTPPSSWKARLVIPVLDSTTNRLPAVSNCIDRGLVRPVATKAIRYPEATVGRTEFLGASVVEQPVEAKTGITAAARKVAHAN